MTIQVLLIIFGLIIAAGASHKWGFENTKAVVAVIVLSIPGVWFAARVGAALLHGVKGPGAATWIVIGLLMGLIAWLVAKQIGWGTLLGWTFSMVLFGCFLVMAVFILFTSVAKVPGGH